MAKAVWSRGHWEGGWQWVHDGRCWALALGKILLCWCTFSGDGQEAQGVCMIDDEKSPLLPVQDVKAWMAAKVRSYGLEVDDP